MLVLRKITLENFGPFKGTQSIELPQDQGVVIVYGENMRGKTTLLNAIRYAFYGYVTGRGERHLEIEKIGNWEAAAEGHYGFKVVLEFDYAGTSYELMRRCMSRTGVTKPQTAHDYEQETLLRRGPDVLGPDQRDRVLAEILPEKVSRFFLFDGELLQQYEELLRDDSTMGPRIKEAVERILGLPVLMNARADLRELYQQAQSQEGKAAQRDQRTRELGNQHQALVDRRAHHQEELARLAKDGDALSARRKSTEDQLRKNERLKGLLTERDALQADLAEIDRKVDEKRTRARELRSQAWRWLLQPALAAAAEANEARIADIRGKESGRAVALHILKQTEDALAAGKCDSCERPLDSTASDVLRSRVAALKASTAESHEQEALAPLLQRQATLREFLAEGKEEVLRAMLDTIDELRVERRTKADRVAEIQEQTKNLDESEIRKLATEYDKMGQELAILNTGIQNQAQQVAQCEEDIRRVQDQLNKVGGADLAEARKRRETSEAIRDLFGRAVDKFRDRLRQRVEADASELFRHLTTEPDYARLSINENYGLTIVHEDGELIPVRSAGAEHIVALSLMGALQRNAPLRGPIIMDSPFGRLDAGHTTRVVRTLPSMANQVLLLVYENELEPQLARNELKARLRREYRLIRKTARQSSIEPYTE
jgi:DNA sulfur modification protein DndD